jgi:RNA polymerase sigma-70 factor (ECF subfamily)
LQAHISKSDHSSSVTETPHTLLERLCSKPAPADWERFVRLFTPLLRRWATRFGVREPEAEDVLQELFVLLIRKLPEFRYNPNGSFRAWLWTTFRHLVIARHNAKTPARAGLAELEELASPDSVAEATEAEYQRYLLGRITQIVQADFPDRTWQIFKQVAIEGRPGVDVAKHFGLSVNSVYLARGRVLARLREELGGLDR